MGTQGKPLTPEEKETIVKLKKYFDRTIDDPIEQACLSVERVENALALLSHFTTINLFRYFFYLSLSTS